MGIVDFLKSGVKEMMLARPDDKKDLLVYKHPDATIPHWAQLTVDADEAAVFFRDGSVVGTLRTAGVGQRHTLSAQNVPFLSRLVDSFTGGNVFVTDLFYVTMRPIFNVPFGGELDYMEDPLLGEMVTPRIFGTFSFQVLNPEALIVRYTGVRATTKEDQEKWIKDTFLRTVATVVGQVCVEEQKSLLELGPLRNKLAERFVQSAPDLNAIGIQILEIGNFKVNLSPEDEGRLREAQAELGAAKRAARKAKIGIAEAEAKAQQRQFELDQNFQNDGRYVQELAGSYGNYAAGKAMMGAGEGMAKGGGEGGGGGPMMAGAGLGAGFAMANVWSQNMQQAQAAPAPKAPAGPTTCPECAAQVPGGKFCASCGASLAPRPKFCPSCGAQGLPAAKFCADCGTSFPT